jgi:hypothetical protein
VEFDGPVNRFVSGVGRRRRKEGAFMSREYKSGTYCIEVKCPKHKELEGLTGDAYLKKKKVHCKKCLAWQFFSWAKDNQWRIVHTWPEVSNKQLAAMIKGIDPVRVEDLTEEEIMCL